ncbi:MULTISPECIES: phosphopantetheine-binding protein [Methylomonas]|uniref:phosphopantetheine-binding protein n=1 Tax=Methylomonas TaxID=416 RepID=UPI0012326A72|nr:phosphopantetheine-binding protein [Methylomonas rhizoryzae]
MDSLEAELKQLIIDIFELDALSPQDIGSEAPLFGEGLGLDSIDALELGVALKKKYCIDLDVHTPAASLARHFASVHTLAAFVVSQQHATHL